jgi:hypothetical protein
VDGVLQPALVATDPRSDGLLGSVSHDVIARCSESWPLVPAEDPGPEEDLTDGHEFHAPWTQDYPDPISRGGGDAKVYQQISKPVGGDRSFSPKGLLLVRISVHPLDLYAAWGRVLLIVLVLIANVVVVLLLLWLLLIGCALGCWAPRCHQLDHKSLLLL